MSKLNRICSVFLLCCMIALSSGVSYSASDSSQEVPIDMSGGTEDTISMSFDGALLKDVLMLFSQQSGLNFVTSQDVESKKVTVYFENVTPKDALDAIMSTNGLAYSKKPGSDIISVYPANRVQVAETVTKVIHLSYMRLAASPLDVGGQATISQMAQTASVSASSSASSSGGSASTGSSGGSSGSSGDRGADAIVQKLLSPTGKVVTDIRTNSLIITDTVENVAKIEKVLAQIDVPPSQVVLEVNIMEVTKGLVSDMGVEWGGADGKLASLTGGLATTKFPFHSSAVSREVTGGVLSAAGALTASGDANDASQKIYGVIDARNLGAVLHMIETDSNTKVLAKPRVLTQNNEAAVIKLVSHVAIGETVVSSGEGASAQQSNQAERAEVGVALSVTTQINPDDTVILFIEPAYSTVSPSALFPTQFQDTTTRLVRTMARVKDNQTLVIGGLMEGQYSESKRKFPFLGDLPLVGKAFRYDAKDHTDRELVVFLTPHIVRGSSSLGPKSATANGQDVALRRALDEFMDRELDSATDTFQNFEKRKSDFYSKDEELVRASERRLSNPLVESQMNQALDALSPQMVDYQMGQALDTIATKKK